MYALDCVPNIKKKIVMTVGRVGSDKVKFWSCPVGLFKENVYLKK